MDHPQPEENIVSALNLPISHPAPPPERIAPAFYLIWVGQVVSMLGTQLTGFALGVWLFQRTGSVLDFSQLIVFSTLPALLLMPWSGSLADRFDRRLLLMACEAVALAAAATLAIVLWLGRFEVWHLMAMQALLSISLAFQAPAVFATISSLVPKARLAQAAGLFQAGNAVSQFLGPLVGAVLLASIGIEGIVTLDAASFAVALATLAAVRLPALATSRREGLAAARRNALRDMEWSFDYLVQRPALATLYVYTALCAFLCNVIVVMITPLVLSGHDERALSWVLTSGAFGVLASSLLMMSWGGPRRYTPFMFGACTLQGLAIAWAGWDPHLAVLCACSFVATASGAFLSAYMSTFWRRKVARERHGAFGALHQSVVLALVPLSAVAGGTLAHHVFEPALLSGGLWADSLGPWFGVGKGRGTGLLFVVVGLAAALVSLLPMLHAELRRIDEEVPDAPPAT